MPMQQEDSSIGQVIDGYRILEVLGKGGMGIVYKAEDIALSRTVAIKMIAPELATNDSFLRRFHSEARALARVESPFIVGVHALRQVEDSFFIVMEYVDGWTLADEIEKGPIDFSRARVVLRQMLQAFSRAHSVGVIHRDIKPRNIMITDAGRVKVTDFGLAKLRQDDGKSTVTQGMAGTARYMSPEQVLGTDLDHRSDLYSLGMTMYEMLAGVLPFGVEEGTFAILKRIVEEELPSPLEYNPNIPQGLVNIVLKAIQKSPASRFQTSQEMLAALDEVFKTPARREPATLASEQPSQIHVAPPQPLQKKARKNPLIIAAAVACLLLIYPVSKLFSGGDGSENEQNKRLSQQPGALQPDGTNLIKYAELTISTIPAGATLVVNRDSMGVVSKSGLKLDVPEGEVNLAFHLDGYQKLDTMITVFADGENLLEIPLSKMERNVRPVPVTSTTNLSKTPVEDTPAPAVVTGLATLSVQPAGTIYVNGKSYKNSTSSLALPVGLHSVKFEDGKTGTAHTSVIEVEAGKTISRVCYFQHSLTVKTLDESDNPPWATIYINGEEIWSAPLDDYKLHPGEYTISLKRSGFVLSEPQKLSILPTFNEEETNHKLFFTIKKEQ